MTKDKLTNIISAYLPVLLVGIWAQHAQSYRFYAKEAEHLWMNDWSWIAPHFTLPGGIAQLLSSLLTQCYAMPFVGAAVFTIVSILIVCSVNSISKSQRLLPLALLVPVFLMLSHENVFYNIKGDIALLLSVLTIRPLVAIISRVGQKDKKSAAVGLLASIILPVALYWIAGSTTVVMAASVLAVCLLRKKWIAGFVPLIAVVTFAYIQNISYYHSWKMALTPAQYYEWPSTYFFQIYAWVSVVVAIIVNELYHRLSTSRLYHSIIVAVCVIAIGVTGLRMFSLVHNEKNYIQRTEEWMARQHDWDGIIALHQNDDERVCFVSYLNLALAKKGMLTERLFEFHPYVVGREEIGSDEGADFQGDGTTGASKIQKRQYSPDEPMCAPLLMKSDELSRDGQKVQSAVMYEWGGAALCNAQKAAFETNMLTPGCCDPDELKRLVLTNMVFETPLVADKYLRRLQRTTFYKAWADSVMSNKTALRDEASRIRKTLPQNNSLYMKTQIGHTLYETVNANPANEVAAQFFEAYVLLSVDRKRIREWATQRHAQGRKLSTLLQQALLVCAPDDMSQEEWQNQCSALGVTAEVMDEYRKFVNQQLPQDYEISFWCFYKQYYM